MNVIIPIGGKGERFSKEGYSTPKPLIEIFDKTMIEYVLRNIKINVNASHANHASDILFIIYNIWLAINNENMVHLSEIGYEAVKHNKINTPIIYWIDKLLAIPK
jgi:GTP:adenosylcobinamide-phosphate guanylyltransferase